ncbi:hypothetical protein CK203_084347 [Vitis vinifera]|uniref:Uncharacterized protein n=1 Tax=Vitis vinifera TaxID=29760 RepID=A0A438DF70_VITVI|nr:hypothetical protein CK203_084347 [Vitis vinifera]
MPSCRNDDWIKNLYELRSRVHPSGSYVDPQRREGEDDNFEWRLAIERRQLASERQLKALLQETERLREENVVLRIQASTSGPPRRQRSRGQVANSRPQQEPESIYPGITGAIPEHATQDLMSHARLCLELPVRKAQTLLTFQQKDNVIKNPSCQIRCAQD